MAAFAVFASFSHLPVLRCNAKNLIHEGIPSASEWNVKGGGLDFPNTDDSLGRVLRSRFWNKIHGKNSYDSDRSVWALFLIVYSIYS
jgi:hypothetical protein